MKLGKNVLVEIVSIVQGGLVHQTDVSDDLRNIDLELEGDELVLSHDYLKAKGRISTN